MPIRPATVADVPAMRSLLAGSPGAAQWSEAQLKDLLGLGTYRLSLILENDGPPLGFLVARLIGAEWELENIVIAESARRSGLGSQLVAALVNHARSASAASIFLEVRESNLPARGLYAKFGFQPSGRRPRYYRDPVEDAVLYRLDLP